MGDRWTCPRCDREFGRANQAHVCVPGGSVEDSFAGRPPVQRAIYDALICDLGPFHADAVKVGVFLKHARTFLEVRPMARSLSLMLVLARPVDHPRIVRRIRASADRIVHDVRLRSVDEIDDQIRSWLVEAYDAAG